MTTAQIFLTQRVSPNRCLGCMGHGARSSLQLIAREADPLWLSDGGLCGKCGKPSAVWDVTWLLIQRWHGALGIILVDGEKQGLDRLRGPVFYDWCQQLQDERLHRCKQHMLRPDVYDIRELHKGGLEHVR